MSHIAIVFGTRPEAIKLFPVIDALKKSNSLSILTINTGQHKEMCNQVLDVFSLKSDISLELMSNNQTPADVLAKATTQLTKIFIEKNIGGVVVQGDTTTALAATLAATYNKIPVAHVEAGLRTYDRENPFPEEINRVLISHAANIHFAPTKRAVENLNKEGILDNVFLTGNTVVDSVNWIVERLSKGEITPDKSISQLAEEISGDLLLVTGHRREHFDQPIRRLCQALKELLLEDPNLNVIYPVHLNPNIQQPVFEILRDTPRCHLLEPLNYPSMIYLMKMAKLIITDSGGIQEEAPSLGTPVIITRKVTERSEAIDQGLAKLVELDEISSIKDEVLRSLQQQKENSLIKNPFGEGNSGQIIAELLEKAWG